MSKNIKKQLVLVTGCAGFIGFHVALSLINNKNFVVFGIDNLNPYYDTKLKKDRLKILTNSNDFRFFKIDISHHKKLKSNFIKFKYDIVIHLAAQAGIRYSLKNTKDYLVSNIIGTYNIFECSKLINIKHLIFASSSSVYGDPNKSIFDEDMKTDRPLSFYATTKKSNETLAHTYSSLYKLPITGLRFFTVYGPFGRPDMALYNFVEAIKNGKTINLYNNGNHLRDFTYIDDVVYSIIKLIKKIPKVKTPFKILNIGSNNPVNISSFVRIIEEKLKKSAKIKFIERQKGDVKNTNANTRKLRKLINYAPKTRISNGIGKYISWHTEYYK